MSRSLVRPSIKYCTSSKLIELSALATIASANLTFSLTPRQVQVVFEEDWRKSVTNQTEAATTGRAVHSSLGDIGILIFAHQQEFPHSVTRQRAWCAPRIHESVVPIDTFMAKIQKDQVPRVPGTAVFLTRTERDVPPVMVWYLKQNRALHERLFVLTVKIELVPWIRSTERLTMDEIAHNFWRTSARFG